MNTITVEAILNGSQEIQKAKDDIRRFLSIMKPIWIGQSLIGKKFNHPTINNQFWWELRNSSEGSLLQLWEIVDYAQTFVYWQGHLDQVPPTWQVIPVRAALPALLAACEEKIEGFADAIRPYLVK